MARLPRNKRPAVLRSRYDLNIGNRLKVVVLTTESRTEIWVRQRGGMMRHVGTVSTPLGTDAQLWGQDLVGELVEMAIRELERSCTAARNARDELRGGSICR